MAFLTEATYHQASPDRILGGFMVAPVAVDTGNPGLSHSAFPPGQDEARIDLFMAIDTDLIIHLGGYTSEVQGEKDYDKADRRDPTTVDSPFHKASPSPHIF
jgi:hypothetical protein